MHGPLNRYVATVAAAGLVAAFVFGFVVGIRVADVPTFVVLSAVAFVAATIPVRFQHRGGTQGFTLEAAVFVALLLSGPAGVVPLLLTLMSLAAHALRGHDARKALFNAGKTGLETTAGAAVFLAVAPAASGPTDLRSLGAATLAAVVFEAVSIGAMTELFYRLESTSRRRITSEVSRLSLITFVGNTSYGIILAAVAKISLAIALLSGLVMLGLYLGYRGYAAAVDGQRRAESLSEMTHFLLDLPGTENALPRLLSRLARVLGATSGELHVRGPDGQVLHWLVSGESISFARQASLPQEGHLGAALASGEGLVVRRGRDLPEDARDAVIAPISRKGEPVGVMAVYGRRGIENWDEADANLLSAIANELAVALDNVELFEQVERERARLESESTKLGDILGAASDGITLIRDDGAIESWNPGMERITGVPRAEAVGQPWFVVLRLRDEDGEELLPGGHHSLARALAGERNEQPVALQALRRDGDWRWLQCTTSPIMLRDHDGTGGVVLVARDVTAEREVEELKSDFIATVSHELRTPLTPLKGFLATLRQRAGHLTPEQLRGVNDSMSSQVARLEMLIADLLAVAELDHGRFDVRPEAVDLAASVRAAIDVESAAAGAGASDRCTVVAMRPVAALADPVALARVLRALVSNALKHTEGAVTVVVEADDTDAFVRVRDEGPGIAPWDQKRIFGRFERLGDHLRRTQGPGLGLTIAQSFAARMNGEILVESDVNRGSEFALRLPRAKPRAVPTGIAATS